MKKSPVTWAVIAFVLTSSPALADVTSLAMGAAITAGVAVAAGIGLVATAAATPAVAIGVGVGVLGVGLLGLVGVGLDPSDPNSAANPANTSTIKANLTPNTSEQDAALADKQNAYNSGQNSLNQTGQFSPLSGGKFATVLEALQSTPEYAQSDVGSVANWGKSYPDPACVGVYAGSSSGCTTACIISGGVMSCTVSYYHASDGTTDTFTAPMSLVCPDGTAENGGNCLPPYDASKPTVQTTSDNRFQPDPTNVPPGGMWVKQPDNSWDYYGPGGEWGSVSSNGQQFTMSGEDGNGNLKSTQVTTYTDGSKNISTAVSLPVTDPSGNVSTIPGVVTTTVTVGGTKTGTTVQTGPGVDPNTTSLTPGAGGNGQTLTGQTGTLTGGTGTGTGTDPGTGTGSCESGDCATETTQLANKGLLEKIADFFGTAGTPAEVSGPSDADMEGVGFGDTFSDLLGWAPCTGDGATCAAPECPVLSFDWNIGGRSDTIETNDYCVIFEQNRNALSAVFIVLYGISGLFIVLRA